MKNPEKTIKSSIFKIIGCAVIAVIGIILAVTLKDIPQIVGIILAAVGGIGMIANGIVLAIAYMYRDLLREIESEYPKICPTLKVRTSFTDVVLFYRNAIVRSAVGRSFNLDFYASLFELRYYVSLRGVRFALG